MSIYRIRKEENNMRSTRIVIALKLILSVFVIIFFLNHFGIISFPLESGNENMPVSSETANLPIDESQLSQTSFTSDYILSLVPEYSGNSFVMINDGIPFFTGETSFSIYSQYTFEHYSELDNLGRCGTAFANISKEIMPTEKRGDIGSVKPTGWQTAKYDIVEGKYLYNRCHLIAYMLAGENANNRNLITGTRYLNIQGMLPFEVLTADYLEENDCHVLYRVTPIFKDNELVARGVLMEGYSVEDNGKDVCFCAFCYNVQPGITIDYSTGNNFLSK